VRTSAGIVNLEGCYSFHTSHFPQDWEVTGCGQLTALGSVKALQEWQTKSPPSPPCKLHLTVGVPKVASSEQPESDAALVV
jgi:hypothetical protein